ncbi:MAG: AraC family transcriptional regulator [Gammaproteobacteria bacterium]|nr:AraC family transcriptional regulator [Gammaproteobacteria bacterium]
MQGVPDIFDSKKDQAQFRILANHPEIELYRAHIEKHAFEPHTHEAFGIGTIIQGAERFRYRGSDYIASTDALVLMNPDELHTGQAETETGWRYQMIYIDTAALENISGLRDLWFPEVLRHDQKKAKMISFLLNQIWQSEDVLDIDCLLLSLISQIQPYVGVGKQALPEPKHRFDIVKDYMRDYLSQQITLPELASLVNLSPYHFLRQFVIQYHVTPQQMLMAYRLFKAKQLLAQGIPSATVAAETGLTDQSHLIRAFTRRYGTTPAKYQKSICPTKQQSGTRLFF